MDINIRRALLSDVPGIREIYNHAIRTSASTFDMEEKSLADREAWFESHDERHPILVALTGEKVVGWASLTPFSDRLAYRYSVENSVYLREDTIGKGIGTQLMAALMVEARQCGHHAVIAQITGGNEISRRLHQRLGFRAIGTLYEVGWKFDRWHDLLLMEAVLKEV